MYLGKNEKRELLHSLFSANVCLLMLNKPHGMFYMVVLIRIPPTNKFKYTFTVMTVKLANKLGCPVRRIQAHMVRVTKGTNDFIFVIHWQQHLFVSSVVLCFGTVLTSFHFLNILSAHLQIVAILETIVPLHSRNHLNLAKIASEHDLHHSIISSPSFRRTSNVLYAQDIIYSDGIECPNDRFSSSRQTKCQWRRSL